MSEPVRPSPSEGRDPGYKVHSTSRGAHGLRHAYPQERMRGLVRHAEHRAGARHRVDEMGHLGPGITTTYLR